MEHDVLKIAELVIVALVAGGGVVALWGATRWISSRTSRPLPLPEHPSIDDSRLARLENAVDAIAVEVERISESQRFTAKIMAERKQNQLPPADP